MDAAGDASGDGAPALDGRTPTVALTLFNHPTSAAMFELVVAYQDGSGPWTLAPAPTGDTYELPIASGRYGSLWSCATPTMRVVNLGYFTVGSTPRSATRSRPAARTRSRRSRSPAR